MKRRISRLENQLSELQEVVQAHLIIKAEPTNVTDDNVFSDETEDYDASDLPRSPPPAAAEPDSTNTKMYGGVDEKTFWNVFQTFTYIFKTLTLGHDA